jgi:hypothetical protein
MVVVSIGNSESDCGQRQEYLDFEGLRKYLVVKEV